MSQNEALKSDFQHPFKWKVQLPTGPGNVHKANQGRPWGQGVIGPFRMEGHGFFFLPARKSLKVQVKKKKKKCRLLQRPPEGTGMGKKRTHVTYPESKRPAYPEWSCLGICPCTCQRPTSPRRGKDLNRGSVFYFHVKSTCPRVINVIAFV